VEAYQDLDAAEPRVLLHEAELRLTCPAPRRGELLPEQAIEAEALWASPGQDDHDPPGR
jgi:hypothetical protein